MQVLWLKMKTQLSERLFGRPDVNYSTNKEIINATISFMLTTEQFNCPFLKLINSSKSEALQSPPYIFFHFSLSYLIF